MKWFKFYGQDFLTDSRVGSLSPLQKLMWVGLLCIASQDEERSGLIPFLTEDHLMRICGIDLEMLDAANVKPYVTLETFCNMKLVTCNNDGSILVNNFHKKQTQQSSSTERVREWRARNRAILSPFLNETNETNVTLHSNGRVDKSRIEETHASPSARVSPLTVKTKNMRKNSFKYNEGNHTDHFETVIDADTGEVSNAPKSNASHLMKELLDWAAKRRGSPFVNLGKQYKAMAVMRRAGKNPSDIKNRWTELEKDDFFKKRGFDFMDLANSFDRK